MAFWSDLTGSVGELHFGKADDKMLFCVRQTDWGTVTEYTVSKRSSGCLLLGSFSSNRSLKTWLSCSFRLLLCSVLGSRSSWRCTGVKWSPSLTQVCFCPLVFKPCLLHGFDSRTTASPKSLCKDVSLTCKATFKYLIVLRKCRENECFLASP